MKKSKIRFSVGESAATPDNPRATTKPKAKIATVEEFVKKLTAFEPLPGKTAGWWICPAQFPKGSRRLKSKALPHGGRCMLFDFDGLDGAGVPNELIDAWLAELRARNICYFAYTSYSHATKSKPGHSRCRIGIFANADVTPDKWKRCWAYWAAFFSDPVTGVSHVDRAPQHIASIFYGPSCPPGTKDQNWAKSWIEGGGFDPALCQCDERKIRDLFAPRAGDSTTQDKGKKSSRANRGARGTQSVAMRGETLPRETVFILSDGRPLSVDQIKPGEKHACFSPWRDEKTPSAFVAATDKGRVFCHDSGDGQTRWVESVADRDVRELFSVTHYPFKKREEECVTTEINKNLVTHYPLRREKEECMTDEITTTHFPADPDRYLADQVPSLAELLPYGGLLVLDAGLGAGKTQLAAREARTHERVLVATDSVALTRSLSHTFSTQYYDTKDPHPDRLSTTINSLPKWHFAPLDDETYRWDLAICDEFPLVRKSLFNNTTKRAGAQGTKESLLGHLVYAKWAIVSAADFSEAEINWIIDAWRKRRVQAYGEATADVHVIHRPAIAGNRELAFYSHQTQDQLLIEDLTCHTSDDDPLLIVDTSKKAGMYWEERIKKINPELKVKWITALNSRLSEIRESLKDPDSLLRDYDVIIVSPSIKAGVSWTLPVKRVYCFFTAELSARECGQMVLRARNPKDKTIRVAYTERHADWSTNRTEVEKDAKDLAHRTKTMVDKLMLQYVYDYQAKDSIPVDPELFSAWVDTEIERRENANNSLAEFLKICKHHGWTTIDRRDQEITDEQATINREQKREAKEAVREQLVEEILAAPQIGEEEADQIEAKPEVTSAEQASLARHKIEKFYGMEADEELVKYDLVKKARQRVRDYARVSLLREHKEAIILLDAKSQDLTEYKNIFERTKWQLLLAEKILGCELAEADGVTLTAETIEENLGKTLEQYMSTIQSTLKSKITQASIDNPSKWALGFLRGLGIDLQAKQVRREDGSRTRQYTVHLDDIERLAAAEKRRILDRWEMFRAEHAGFDVDSMLTLLAA